jgi:catabolite regulation protein CreA
MSLAAGAPSNHVEAVSANHVDLESSLGSCTTQSGTLEADPSKATANVDGTNIDGTTKRCQRNRRIAVCACCSSALTVAIAVFIFACCMRDPEWTVVETHIDPASLMAMSMAIAMGSNDTAEMTMTNTVRIYNPNFIGAFVEPDEAQVTCHNEEFATSTMEPFTLRRRGVTMVTSNVSVHLSPTLGPAIVQDVMANNGTIIVYAKAESIAYIGWIRLHTGVECKIWASMMPFITGQHPEDSIQKKECTYWKRL